MLRLAPTCEPPVAFAAAAAVAAAGTVSLIEEEPPATLALPPRPLGARVTGPGLGRARAGWPQLLPAALGFMFGASHDTQGCALLALAGSEGTCRPLVLAALLDRG